MSRFLTLFLCLCLLLACIPTLSACDGSSEAKPTEQPRQEAADDKYYILNTSTKKYHLTDCSYLPSAANSKKVLRSATSTYHGYTACQHCNP